MGVLALDVGNTRLKWAYYEHAYAGAPALEQGAEFLEQIDDLSESAWSHLPQPEQVLGCIVAGDAVKQRVHEQLELWNTDVSWLVPQAQQGGLSNGYDHPARLGADRWAAMIGGRQYLLARGQSRPLLLVMVGTAVTVEAVDDKGQFLGGLILPGHGIMLRSLLYGTAGLHVPTGEVVAFPTNTSDALTSGGTYAITGAVQRMRQMLAQHCQQEAYCIMTGGAAWKMAPYMEQPVVVEESLIFDGLLHVYASKKA